MAREDARKAVRATQMLLSIQHPSIVVDGVWGPKSAQALKNTSGQLKEAASITKAFADGLSPSQPSDDGHWISKNEIERLILRVSDESGLNPSWLRFIVSMEPELRRGISGTEYNARSVAPSGLYFGIAQVGKPAWEDAKQVFPRIGEFEVNKFDPELNLLAAAGYVRKNMSYARNIHGYDGLFNKELVYAMHNQGHTFISSAYKGGIGRYASGQSDKAKGVLSNAADLVRQYASVQPLTGEAIG